MEMLAGIVVGAFGLFLIGLGWVSAFRRESAERFLDRFASSAAAHYTEQILRAIVGLALIGRAPLMLWPGVFTVFGWVILVTAVALLLTPWRWHNRFAGWAIPFAKHRLRFFAVCSFGLGVFVLYGLIRPAPG